MTHDEIIKALFDETMIGNAPAVLELTNKALAEGMGPDTILFEALIPSLEEVGARFERGDYFVPEMLIAGKAMSGALNVLRPLLAETGAETVGTFLMGTVKGDVHDIGKNLVNIMLKELDLRLLISVYRLLQKNSSQQSTNTNQIFWECQHSSQQQCQCLRSIFTRLLRPVFATR